ncbi:MAG: hypothetical protein ACXWV5_09745 [Flavitalea sp.]
MNRDYHSTILDAINTLHNAENEIFTAMVNTGMQGVYKDVIRSHEVGDVIDLELAMFEDTGDQNLDALIEAIKAVATAKQTLANLNNIDLDELELE